VPRPLLVTASVLLGRELGLQGGAAAEPDLAADFAGRILARMDVDVELAE